MPWPSDRAELVRVQEELGRATPSAYVDPRPATVAGCFVCFDRQGRAYAAAALLAGRRLVGQAVAVGRAPVEYEPGLLALREGPVLAAAVTELPVRPELLLLVNATGRDHPRRAGLALHLGAALDLPTVGVTHRPLYAAGAAPGPQRGESAALLLDGEEVGAWLRTRTGARPVAVHAGWRTSPALAVAVVLGASWRAARTPEPLRRAREAARRARTRADAAAGLRA